MEGTTKQALTKEEKEVLNSCGDEVSYRLTEERRLRLDSIGFVWNMREGEKGTETVRITRNSYDDQWVSSFDLMGIATNNGLTTCQLLPPSFFRT